MTSRTLSDNEKELLGGHEGALERFQKHIETQWETLADQMHCDVSTAKKIFAYYEHKKTVGPLR